MPIGRHELSTPEMALESIGRVLKSLTSLKNLQSWNRDRAGGEPSAAVERGQRDPLEAGSRARIP